MNPISCGAMAAILISLATAPAWSQTPQPGPAFLTGSEPAGLSESALVGLDVIGMDHERVGRTEDVILDAEGRARTVVIGTGGLLGLGEKRVAVPFDQFVWVSGEADAAAQPRSSTAPGNAPSAAKAETAGPQTMPGAQISNDVLSTIDEKRGGAVNDATGSVAAKDQARGRATVPITGIGGRPIRAEIRLTKAMLQSAPAYRTDAAR